MLDLVGQSAMDLTTGYGWVLALWIGVAIGAAGHALISRRDPRTAWGWIAVCWLFPFAGPALYFLFGINRIRTHAQRLGMDARGDGAIGRAHADDLRNRRAEGEVIPPWLDELARTADRLTHLPLLDGNRIEVLHNGEQAYPRMLAAIDGARRSVALATYIFDNDAVGRRFVEALARAQARGVDVHVMIDGFGQHYSLVPITRELRRAGIDHAVFNPLRLLPPSLHLNLRSHRKLLLIDGAVGYTGGMNIGRRQMVGEGGSGAATDMQFELRGPILNQLGQVFADDWRWCGKPEWRVPPAAAGDDLGAACRVVTDGPNEDFDHLTMVLQAAISAAHREVRIMTPYFLPPNEMIAELQAAALRGVRVEVILPARSNLPFVHWATRNMLGELLRFGVRVYYQPPPFCHSKLFVVDGVYAQIGSANLDARSLKLNFELTVEVYDRAFAQTLNAHFDAVRTQSRDVPLAEIDGRSLPARLRDAAFWLFSPYL
ncbi:phospholipase D-like domain-containing protein [Fontimonas sp. SYSU GA230001]|uniref:phospholipase D-like domain-containing protein n=1 Tax=Fontimonas sp. SYSU GA230001 TaxID=3142450 RepID=UPI0032B4DF35